MIFPTEAIMELNREKAALKADNERLRGLLREAIMLLFDWDTLNFGRAGDTVRETKEFLKRLGYDGTKPFSVATDQPDVCQHGIRAPWECKECADAAWEAHQRAADKSEGGL
jgi:hypothetical protein